MPDIPLPNRSDAMADELTQEDISGFVDQSPVPTMAIDRDLRYIYANQAYCQAIGRPIDEVLGKYVFDIYQAPSDHELSFRRKCSLSFQGEVTRSEVQTSVFTDDEGRSRTVYWQTTQEPYFGRDGQVRCVVHRVEDVTHLVELQKSHDVIVTELDHRVKNFVSVILATARITSLSADSVEQYTEDFCSRVDSMARIYSRMSADGLRGLSLRSVFEDELAQVAARKNIQYSLKGDDVQLTVKSSKDGGMVIHEFVTNAVRHGCFSRPEGRLDVEWAVVDNELRVLWVESGLTGIKPPDKKGFGTRLTDMLPNARVTRTYHDTGLTIEYIVPVEVVTDDGDHDENWLAGDQ